MEKFIKAYYHFYNWREDCDYDDEEDTTPEICFHGFINVDQIAHIGKNKEKFIDGNKESLGYHSVRLAIKRRDTDDDDESLNYLYISHKDFIELTKNNNK